MNNVNNKWLMLFSHSIFKSEITLIVLLKIFQRKIVKQYITIIFIKRQPKLLPTEVTVI